MTLLGRIRLRLFVFIIGVPLAAFGAIAIGPSWLALPVIGAAFYAVAMGVNKASQRLQSSCWTCGQSLVDEPGCEHGVACPSCGSLNPSIALVRLDEPDDDAEA